MSKTVVRPARDAASVAIDRAPAESPSRKAAWDWRKTLKPLASLRVTVVLFALAIVLVFAGTLAQVDAGIWTVVNKYFRTAFVWIPLQIFFPRTMQIAGGFPFPGGWLIGSCLLVNLLAAHLVRFKLNGKRSGILLIHGGLIVMMMSELVTGLYGVEGAMQIREGQSANYLEHGRYYELAIVDSSDPQMDSVVVIPDSILRRGRVIHNELLPFDVEVDRYMVNSKLVKPEDAEPDGKKLATAGAGLDTAVVERPEVSGTDQKQTENAPSAYLTFRGQDGTALGTYLMSFWLNPQPVAANGKTYQASLRWKRTYKPYTIHLLEFHHDLYLGTDKPKNFSSNIRLEDPSRQEERDVVISMNSPLRHAGETFYQSSFIPDDNGGPDKGTILQVVRNPGWLMPYISCGMVSIGMIIHFGMHLVSFLRRRVVA